MASAKEFVQSPSMDVLETFKKDMLMQIAQELQLEVKRSTRKHELKRLIVEKNKNEKKSLKLNSEKRNLSLNMKEK